MHFFQIDSADCTHLPNLQCSHISIIFFFCILNAINWKSSNWVCRGESERCILPTWVSTSKWCKPDLLKPAFCLKFPVPARQPRPSPLYTATELPAPSGLGPRSSSAASVVFLLSSSSAPWQPRAGLQRVGRYSAGPPTPGPARIFSPTQDLAIATHNPKWAVRPPPTLESDKLWKSLTQQPELGSSWFLAQRQILTWSSRKFCPQPAGRPVKASVVVTTRPVCQIWSKLSFWPPAKD